MIEKCPCQQCGVNIEFDVEVVNNFVRCPSCGQQTRLLIPNQPASAQPLVQNLLTGDNQSRRDVSQPLQSQTQSVLLFLTLVVLLTIAALLFCIWRKPIAPARENWDYSKFTFKGAFIEDHLGQKLEAVVIYTEISNGWLNTTNYEPKITNSEPEPVFDAAHLLSRLGRDGWEFCWKDGSDYFVKRREGKWLHDYFDVSYQPYRDKHK